MFIAKNIERNHFYCFIDTSEKNSVSLLISVAKKKKRKEKKLQQFWERRSHSPMARKSRQRYWHNLYLKFQRIDIKLSTRVYIY